MIVARELPEFSKVRRIFLPFEGITVSTLRDVTRIWKESESLL